MFKRLVAGVLLALLLTVHGLAQSPSAFPVDITAARAPQPVTADEWKMVCKMGGM